MFLLLVAAGCSTGAPSAPPGTVTVAASPSSVPTASSPAAPTSAPSTTVADAGPCRLDDLAAELAAPEPTGVRQSVRVVWTNRTDRPCTMLGFGGVDLQRAGDRLSVPRTDREPSPVRLGPGERAHSTLTLVPLAPTDPAAFVPAEVVATPPDETHSVVLRWTGGGVLRQEAGGSGATGTTYLEPVRSGAS